MRRTHDVEVATTPKMSKTLSSKTIWLVKTAPARTAPTVGVCTYSVPLTLPKRGQVISADQRQQHVVAGGPRLQRGGSGTAVA